MRSKPLNRVIRSDRDLVALSSRRVTIERVGPDEFRITSGLLFWRSEHSSFIGRYLRRKLPGMQWITGNCSHPTGYYWGE